MRNLVQDIKSINGHDKYCFEDSELAVEQLPTVLKIICYSTGLFPRIFAVTGASDSGKTIKLWTPRTGSSTPVLITCEPHNVQVIISTVEVSPVQDLQHELVPASPESGQGDLLAAAVNFTEAYGLHLVKYLAYFTLQREGHAAAFYQLPGQRRVMIGGAPLSRTNCSHGQTANNLSGADTAEISVQNELLAFLSGVWKGRPYTGQPYFLQGLSLEQAIEEIHTASKAASGRRVVYGVAGACAIYATEQGAATLRQLYHTYDGQKLQEPHCVHPCIRITIHAPHGVVVAVHAYYGYPPAHVLGKSPGRGGVTDHDG